jgi:hypothetical protein
MRYTGLLLIASLSVSCTFDGGYEDYFRDLAMHASLADPRVGAKTIKAGDVVNEVYKDEVSEQAAHMAEAIVPELAAAVIKALVMHGVVQAACQIPGALGGFGPVRPPTEDVERALEVLEAE